MPPYPPADPGREARLVGDICGLLHDHTAEAQARVRRWIWLVLQRVKLSARWWFLESSRDFQVGKGWLFVDLDGDFERLAAAFLPGRLELVPLAALLSARLAAAADGLPLLGEVSHCALESGRRLHFWPLPKEDCVLACWLTRQITVDTLPGDWERIVLSGVVGLYGRHFDRDFLVQAPEGYLADFLDSLRAARARGDVAAALR